MRIIILDAYNLILRSYFGLPPGVDDQGRTNHAIRGWYATWLKLRRVFEPDRVIAVFDGGTDRQRKLLHPEYKPGVAQSPGTSSNRYKPFTQAVLSPPSPPFYSTTPRQTI
jgi:5'-3' exonuclease